MVLDVEDAAAAACSALRDAAVANIVIDEDESSWAAAAAALRGDGFASCAKLDVGPAAVGVDPAADTDAEGDGDTYKDETGAERPAPKPTGCISDEEGIESQ